MVRAWHQHRSSVQCPVFTQCSVKERAQLLHTVLVTVVKEIAQTGVSRLWSRNCGRGVGRHAGGVTVLHHLGVIVVAKSPEGGMQFHDRSTDGGDSDDSDDSDQEFEGTTSWKFGPAEKSDA